MLYSRHHRSIAQGSQDDLFHQAMMAAHYVRPAPKALPPVVATPDPDVDSGFSEMCLNGAPRQCLQWLAPVLRELSQSVADSWLTLLDPPHSVSHAWLRSAGLDPQRILIVRSKSGMSPLELCCDLLRLGCSHTVVSWLDTDAGTLKRALLTQAARDGRCRSLNIRLDSAVAA